MKDIELLKRKTVQIRVFAETHDEIMEWIKTAQPKRGERRFTVAEFVERFIPNKKKMRMK